MPEEKKLKLPTRYCESIYQTIRRPTRTIQIGKVETGSAHPVRLQTMTTTGEAGLSFCCCSMLRPSAVACKSSFALLLQHMDNVRSRSCCIKDTCCTDIAVHRAHPIQTLNMMWNAP